MHSVLLLSATTTFIAVQLFLCERKNILILTKIYLPKSLSYGKELHPPTHVCKISILICWFFVGVLEYCTPDCDKLFVYWSMPIESKAVAM